VITIAIIILTALISIAGFSNADTLNKLSFVPFSIQRNKEWYRFVSHAFVHNDAGHLIFNMITLFFFGREVELRVMSPLEFILFYVSAIIVAVLPTYNKHKNNSSYAAVGASGAVAAIMFVNVLYNPWQTIYIKFIIPVYYILFAVGYLIYCSYQSKNSKDHIAHDVHLWGSLYGLAFTLILHPEALHSFLEKIQHPPFMR
jgi:membrane associated rhomboid family serine protease